MTSKRMVEQVGASMGWVLLRMACRCAPTGACASAVTAVGKRMGVASGSGAGALMVISRGKRTLVGVVFGAGATG